MAADGTIQIDVNLNSDPAVNGINQVDKKAEGLSGTFNAVSLAAAALIGGIVAIGKAAIDSFTESENATVNLQNQLGLTRKEAEDLTKVAKNIYKKGFGESLDEVSDAVMNVRTNIGDLNDADLEKVTKNSLALAKTFDADVNEVTRAAGNIMKNFGVESDEAFNLLTNGAQNGLNFSGELFDNMAEYAPLWSDLGFSADEMFSILQKGTEEGVYNFDYLNDVVKEFGVRISDGSKGTSDAIGQLLGSTQELYDGFVRGETSGADMAKAIAEDLLTLDDQVQRNQVGVALFGTKWEDLGGDVVLSMLTAENAVVDLGGKTEEVTANMEQTTTQRMEGMKRAITGSLAPLGAEIVKKIDESMKYLVGLFNKYKDDVVDAVKKTWGFIYPYIESVLDAIVPFVKDILDQVLKFWEDNGEQVFQALKNHWDNIVAIIEFVMPYIMNIIKKGWETIKNSIQLVLDVILGIIKIFTGLFTGDFSKMWEGVKQIFDGAIRFIVEAIKNSFIGKMIGYISEQISAFIGKIQELWEGIKNAFSEGISATVQFFKDFGETLVDLIKQIIGHIILAILEGIETIIVSIIEFVQAVIDYIQDLRDRGGNIFLNFLDDVIGVFVSIKDGVVSLVKEMFDRVVEFFTNLRKKGEKEASELKDNVVNFFVSLKDDAVNAVKNLYEGVINFFKQLKNGVVQVVTEFIPSVLDKFKEMTSNAIEQFKNLYTEGVKFTKDLAKDMIEVIKNLPKDFFNYGKSVISGFIDGIKSIDPVQAVKDAMGSVKDAVKGIFDINSPSKWMRDDIVGSIAEGAEVGVVKYKGEFEATGEEMAIAMQNPFRGNSPTFSANSPILNGTTQTPVENNTSNTSSVNITNNFTPRESTPYESILKQEQMLRKLALELG